MPAPVPASSPASPRALPAALSWLILLAAAAILFLRRPDQFTNPQLWAEDGIFFFQAREYGWRALTFDLAGYYHTVPRLVAALAAALDPAVVPHIFVACAVLGTLYVLWRVLSPRCPLPLRPACALALVLVPDAAEVLVNVNNLQWVFVPGFVVLLLSAEPSRGRQRCHDAVAVLAFGLNSPFSIVMTPFFAWRAYARRSRFSVLLAALVAACALLQFSSILLHPVPPPPNSVFNPAAAFSFAGLRVTGSLLFSPWLPHPSPLPLSLALTLTLFVALLVLSLRPNRQSEIGNRQSAAIALVFCASLASTIYRCWHAMPVLCVPNDAARYVYPLQALFLWLLLAGCRHPARACRVACFVVLAWSFVINFPRLRIAPLPDKQWSRYVPQLRAGEAVDVPINPDGWEFPFPARR